MTAPMTPEERAKARALCERAKEALEEFPPNLIPGPAHLAWRWLNEYAQPLLAWLSTALDSEAADARIKVAAMTPADRAAARGAFITYVKRLESWMEPWQKSSLAQHWRGKEHGFKEEYVQQGYNHFCAGYQVALDAANAARDAAVDFSKDSAIRQAHLIRERDAAVEQAAGMRAENENLLAALRVVAPAEKCFDDALSAPPPGVEQLREVARAAKEVWEELRVMHEAYGKADSNTLTGGAIRLKIATNTLWEELEQQCPEAMAALARLDTP